MMRAPTLHDLARYYRNAGLVGEERAGITSTVALLGGASVVWRGYPGTGKTVGAEICVRLIPEKYLATVDMLSKLGIWSRGIADRIRAARIVWLPEQQNTGDNDEVVKVLKKWGDGRDAERGKSEEYGASTSVETLPCRAFVSTAAITNAAHEKSWDLESARRVIVVSTNPSEEATGAVLDAQADALVYGEAAIRCLTPLEKRAVEKHVARVMARADVRAVRFFGAREMKESIPKMFPETRSAFALFTKVLLGVGRWYADSEVVVNGEVYLSPQRAAEAWSFYADILDENARKFETSDREILGVFPQPVWTGEAIAPECALDIHAIMRKLKPLGLTDPALVKRQVARLVAKGFLAEAVGFTRARWHRTSLSDVANRVEWEGVVKTCRARARELLDGDARRRYLALCDAATGSRGMTNPLTGEVGPLYGPDSVLYLDAATGRYAPVGERRAAQPRGILAYGNRREKK